MKPLPFNPENWRYEFDSWKDRLGGIPERLLASHDRSEDHMDRAHVFKIRSGRFALIVELGCSCYVVNEADIYIYGDEGSAMADYFKWFDKTPVMFSGVRQPRWWETKP
jgi:hypothetical protein